MPLVEATTSRFALRNRRADPYRPSTERRRSIAPAANQCVHSRPVSSTTPAAVSGLTSCSGRQSTRFPQPLRRRTHSQWTADGAVHALGATLGPNTVVYSTARSCVYRLVGRGVVSPRSMRLATGRGVRERQPSGVEPNTQSAHELGCPFSLHGLRVDRPGVSGEVVDFRGRLTEHRPSHSLRNTACVRQVET